MATTQITLPAGFDFEKRGQQHFDALVSGVNEDVKKLPETIFKSVFLPVFSGQRAVTDTDEMLRTWVGIAGAPGREVEIIDNAGNALFRVPPLFDTSFIDAGNAQGTHQMSKMIAAYDLHRSVLPILGQNFLTTEMTPKIDSITKDNGPNKEHEQRWKEIIGRYATKTVENGIPGEKPGAVGDDDLIY